MSLLLLFHGTVTDTHDYPPKENVSGPIFREEELDRLLKRTEEVKTKLVEEVAKEVRKTNIPPKSFKPQIESINLELSILNNRLNQALSDLNRLQLLEELARKQAFLDELKAYEKQLRVEEEEFITLLLIQ